MRQIVPAVVLLLAACAVGEIDDRVVLDGQTPVTSCAGAIHGAAADGGLAFTPVGDKSDFLAADSFEQRGRRAVKGNCGGSHATRPGIGLRPGDVMHLLLWSHGAANPRRVGVGQDDGNFSAPTLQRHRIPLRIVPEAGRLRDYEVVFLSSLLSTQRAAQFGTKKIDNEKDKVDFPKRLREVLVSRQTHIWNAVMGRIWIKRVQFDIDRQPAEVLFLAGVVDMSAVCADLRDKNLSTDDLAVFAQAFLFTDANTDFDPATHCKVGSANEHELFRVVGKHASAFHVLGESEDPFDRDDKSDFYTDLWPKGLFNFLTVELSGVSARHLEWPESAWSLTEWEQSGICLDRAGRPLSITEITLRNARRPIAIVGDDAEVPPSWRVRTMLHTLVRNDGTEHRSVGRTLERTPESADLLFPEPTMNGGNLQALTMRDLAGIRWSGNEVAPACRL